MIMTGSNLLQMLALVVVFVIVLAATYYITKWIAKSGMIQAQSKNIKVHETFKIATGKYIQIIQLGTKYYAIGVTKDHITFLTSLEEDQLDLVPTITSDQKLSFKDMIERFSQNKNKSDMK